MIACIRKIHSHKQAPKVIKCRSYINYDANKINEDVSKIDWEPVYGTNDVSASLQFFYSKLKAVCDDHAPFVEKRIKGKKSPWLSCEVKKSMNDRDKRLRKVRKSKNEADWVAYKRLRNYCTNLIKRSKTSFHRNLLAENIGNPRKFWSTVKTIFPSKSMKSKDTTAVNVKCESRVNKFSTYLKNTITTLKLAAIPFMIII